MVFYKIHLQKCPQKCEAKKSTWQVVTVAVQMRSKLHVEQPLFNFSPNVIIFHLSI